MKVVVLGLSLSSAWGNGHAVTYRALLAAFAERGHEVLFLERDKPWYAAHRDLPDPAFCRLALYRDLDDLEGFADPVRQADAVIVGSYVPDGVEVGDWVLRTATGVVAFYDIDTPITLARLEAGDREYLGAEQVSKYDIYFSFTGGPTLERLETIFGSPAARALYCSADPKVYRPLDRPKRWDLSYLGTYSDDRQPTLERLLIEPARRAPHLRFVVAGPQYPDDIDWPGNVERIDHLPPAEHPDFYAASRFTLNVTRADMIRAGHSPSIRLFEAAACGTPVISDEWDGLDQLFAPGSEIVLAETSEDVLDALGLPDGAASDTGSAARRRVLTEHAPARRAETLERELLGRCDTQGQGGQPLGTPCVGGLPVTSQVLTRTMRAAVVNGPGRVQMQAVPRPEAGPGQVRVRLQGCGVCASNLTPWAGPDWMSFPTSPGDLGHEGWGVIDAVGEGVDQGKVGQRVATLSHRSYAEYDLADQGSVVPLPPDLDGQAFPGEAVGCAMNIFRRAEISAGQTVAIVGVGFLGAILTRLAAEVGARVIAVTRRPFALDLARRMDAAETIPLEDHHQIISRVSDLTGGRFCDVVIEAVGKAWPLDLAAELTRERGRLVIAGYHQDGPRQVNMQLWNWRGLDVVNAHERDPAVYVRGVREAVDAVVSGRLDLGPLITHAYPLDRLSEALDATRDRPDGFLKAVVTMP